MLRKVGSILVLSISLTMSLSASADTTPTSDPLKGFTYLGSLGPKINDVMNICSDRIWPEHNWKNHNVVSYEGPGRSFLWEGATGKVSVISDDLVLPLIRGSLYSFAEFQGKKSVVINMSSSEAQNMTAYQILDVILHEGFHHFGQKDWVRTPGARGTAFPLESSPRLYRKMLYLRLKDHLVSEGKDETALNKAAFWFQKWKQSSPQEYTNSTDGYEGTAKYVGSIGTILAGQGCNVAEEALFMAAKNFAANYMGQFTSRSKFSLDSEGYDIGGISSIILRFMSQNTVWFQDVKSGKTPTQILLQNVMPMSDELLSGDKEQYAETAKVNNEGYQQMLGSSLTDLQDSQFIRVAPTYASSPGSYSPLAFILPTAFPGLSVVPMRSERVFAANGGRLQSSFGAVFFNGYQNPCADSYEWMAIPASAIQSTANGFKISHSLLNGEAPGKIVTDAKGKKWLCLFE